MIKRITKTKQMRLDELIKYVWDNDGSLFEETEIIRFFTEDNKRVIFDDTGYFETYNWFDPEDLFPVETEEEITEDTEFESAVTVLRDKFGLISISYNNGLTTSIKKTIDNFEKTNYKPLSIYALINDKLELIYEVEDNNREE